MQKYGFYALLSRMKYINRWGLMRCTRTESLSEHTAEVAFLAHALCNINVNIFGGTARSEIVVTAAMYHDASEILTGDMPTPVKYNNEQLKAAYKKTERSAAMQMANMLPDELKQSMAAYITGDVLTDYETQLLKAADRLSAIIKCIEEAQSGNCEFEGAMHQQAKALENMQLPEADYFVKNMLPCYRFTLDRLTEG